MKKNIASALAFIVAFSGNIAFSSVSIAQNMDPMPDASVTEKCNNGNIEACNLLGLQHKSGSDAEKDHRKAISFFTKSCDSGNAFGCSELGKMYSEDDGTAKNVTKAVHYFDKACDFKYTSACKYLGQMYWLGKDVTADKAKAEMYFKKSLAIDPDDFQVRDYLDQLKQP